MMETYKACGNVGIAQCEARKGGQPAVALQREARTWWCGKSWGYGCRGRAFSWRREHNGMQESETLRCELGAMSTTDEMSAEAPTICNSGVVALQRLRASVLSLTAAGKRDIRAIVATRSS